MNGVWIVTKADPAAAAPSPGANVEDLGPEVDEANVEDLGLAVDKSADQLLGRLRGPKQDQAATTNPSPHVRATRRLEAKVSERPYSAWILYPEQQLRSLAATRNIQNFSQFKTNLGQEPALAKQARREEFELLWAEVKTKFMLANSSSTFTRNKSNWQISKARLLASHSI